MALRTQAVAPPCPQILGQRVCPIGLAEAPPVSPEGTQTHATLSPVLRACPSPQECHPTPPLPAFAGHAVTPGASTSPFHRLEDRFPEDRGAEAQRAHCGLEGTARLRCLCPRHTHTLTPFSHTRTHTFDHTVPPAQVLGAIDVTPSENAGQPRARTRPLPETPGKLKPPGFGSGSSRVLPETPRPRPQPATPLAAQVPPTGCPESPAPSPAPLSPSSVSQAGLQFSEGGHGPPTRPCH